MLPEKKEELSQRAVILINWLHVPECAIYKGQSSVNELIKTIDIIKWSLSATLTLSEWHHFNLAFIDADSTLLRLEGASEQEKVYYEVLATVEGTLRSYIEYINAQ